MIKRYRFLESEEEEKKRCVPGRWERAEGKLGMGCIGLPSCKDPYDAFFYMPGEILAIVECRGEHFTDGRRDYWGEQRVVETIRWTEKDSVKLALYGAELILGAYESRYPKDQRPREALEVAKKFLRGAGGVTAREVACAADDAAYAAREVLGTTRYIPPNAASAEQAMFYAPHSEFDGITGYMVVDATYGASYVAYAIAYAAYATIDKTLANFAATYVSDVINYIAHEVLIEKMRDYFRKIVKEKLDSKKRIGKILGR